MLLASYVLRFHQPVLADDRWLRSRPRRVTRALLKHAYGTFEAVSLLGLLIWTVIWLIGRF